MSAEVFIALIQKDIKELDIIAQGLYETEQPSPMIITLASQKAQALVDNLKLLSVEKFNKQLQAVAAAQSVETSEPMHATAPAPQSVEPPVAPQQVAQEEEKKSEKKSGLVNRFAKAIKIAKEEEPERPKIKPIPEVKRKPEVVASEPRQAVKQEEPAPVAPKRKTRVAEKAETPKIEKPMTSSKSLIERAERKESKAEKIIGQKETKISLVAKANDNSLASALARKKVEDLTKMNMADRYCYLRELFGNNNIVMGDTLKALNNCLDIQEAENYLSAHFDWDMNDETVNNFLSFVARHFV